MPGTTKFSQLNSSSVTSVSCANAGDCSAGGYYPDAHGIEQAFVVNEVDGTWHTATEVPGTATLNRNYAQVSSVSCAEAGDCSAGGFYNDASRNIQAFVVNEVHGTWHTATEVPGIAALNRGGNARIDSVSCASPGNCSAGGSYSDGRGHLIAFAVNEVNGTWHTAIQVPGIAALNPTISYGDLSSVSCTSPGNCSGGGLYTDANGHIQPFVVDEVNGTWHTAIEVPGIAALNQWNYALVNSVSCGAPGNCSAAGVFTDSNDQGQAFVVNEVNGTWHTATKVPGLAALNSGGNAGVSSVSCAKAGDCSAGGYYTDARGDLVGFVVNEVNGTWHTAGKVSSASTVLSVSSVSCASPGNCGAGGGNGGISGVGAFVVNEVNGIWHTARYVTGASSSANITSVSCAAAGRCSAGGFYPAPKGGWVQAFVVNEG